MKTLIISILIVLALVLGFSVMEGVKMRKAEETQQTQQPVVKSAEGTNFDGTYTVDPKVSKVVWTGKKKVITTWIDHGTIDVKSGDVTIKASESDWTGTNGKIVFDMTTIKSTNSKGEPKPSEMLDKKLKSADFFDVATYPESSFTLKKVTKNANGSYTLEGDLTIKGVTKAVTLASIESLDFVDGGVGQAIQAQGSVTFNRADYNVRFGSDSFFDNLGDEVIEDEVTLDLNLVAVKK